MCFLSVWRGPERATSSVLLPFLGSNPLIGCFKSISVNMAGIMLPSLASERILFVKACLVFQSFPTEPSGGGLCSLLVDHYS